jgi:hypothetical protein
MREQASADCQGVNAVVMRATALNAVTQLIAHFLV